MSLLIVVIGISLTFAVVVILTDPLELLNINYVVMAKMMAEMVIHKNFLN